MHWTFVRAFGISEDTLSFIFDGQSYHDLGKQEERTRNSSLHFVGINNDDVIVAVQKVQL